MHRGAWGARGGSGEGERGAGERAAEEKRPPPASGGAGTQPGGVCASDATERARGLAGEGRAGGGREGGGGVAPAAGVAGGGG